MRSLRALPTPLLILLSAINAPLAAADELKIETTRKATCSRPSKAGDTISVHYKGTLLDTGAEFDQSYKRGKPFNFVLGAGQVIAGWDQGLEDMCPGEARKLTIPSELAYGEFGRPPVIPGGATLVFETELMDIIGVEQEAATASQSSAAGYAQSPSSSAIAYSSAAYYGGGSTSGAAFGIATAPATPPEDEKENLTSPTVHTLASTATSASSPKTAQNEAKKPECHLLGPFALFVQGALGVVALLSLIFKRWRERPKRPWKIFFFDVSKQVVGSMLTHVLNLAMSMLGTVDMVNAAAAAAASSAQGGQSPNPCSFYILNLAIDTTIGIPILCLLLKILHGLFRFTPLAKPPESIKSGNYGNPPRSTWWLKQALIYFIGLTGMKLFVWFLFAVLPWLPWVGDWALRWTKGNTALQITFVMFVFPLLMNGLQYWIIDSFIMDRTRGGNDGVGYERVQDDEDIDNEDDSLNGDEFGDMVEEEVHGKDADVLAASAPPPLSEVQPMPVAQSDTVARGGQASAGESDPTKLR